MLHLIEDLHVPEPRLRRVPPEGIRAHHLTHIFNKLGISSRTELVAMSPRQLA